MTREEILQLNIIKHQGFNDFIFEDRLSLFQSKIITHSPTYGDYVMIPAAYIKVTGDNYKKVADANTEVRKLSGSITTYTINEIVIHNHKQSIEFVIYLCDLESNSDWYENNKDNPNCKIIKEYPEYKKIGLPVGSKNLKSKLEKFYQKYPMVDPKNY